MNNNYYSKNYIPSITKCGKATLLLGIILCFGPIVVVSGIFGIMPPIAAIIAGTVSQISVSGTYMTFISGNTSNISE
ncbi:hypothetical protein [Romboutsia sp.]|uniref:hypothetical protein n=1 Tax=Romboutsia sp. TaxID=1965302 RepID=UPI003F41A88F